MIHWHKGNRYWTRREGDGKDVSMEQIACQPTRCQLPKGHDSSTSAMNVTCHDCLKVAFDELVEKASYAQHVLKNTKYEKPTGFKFPRNQKKKREPRFQVDPELMERIRAGV